MLRILLVVGARPNFMKAAALLRAAQGVDELKIKFVHEFESVQSVS